MSGQVKYYLLEMQNGTEANKGDREEGMFFFKRKYRKLTCKVGRFLLI